MRRSRGNYSLWFLGTTIILSCFNVFISRISPEASVVLYLIMTIIGLFLAVGRFKDMNMNPWWALLTLLPLVSVIIMFPRGTVGENRYGADPTENK